MNKLRYAIYILLLTIAPTSLFSQKPGKTILITLQFPNSTKENIVNADYRFPSTDIRLIIKNNTDTLTSFFEDWNSWGYFNFQFQLITEDTSIYFWREKVWDKNYPSAVLLFPGDSLIISVDVKDWRFQAYEGCKNLPRKSIEHAKLKVIYQLNKDVLKEYVDDVLAQDDGLGLALSSPHKEKFEKLSLIEKLKSFVTDKLISSEYPIKFLNTP